MPSNHHSDITLILHCSQQTLSIVFLKLMELEQVRRDSEYFIFNV